MDDRLLLQDYVATGSEAAFQGLVREHVNMVYGAALRQMRDAHLAQDVTQAVFILLARKAASLKSSVVLSGWLYRTTAHVASRALRDRIRQHHREQEAASMIANEPVDELWEKLAPHLDGAIGTLGEADRNAVVLRFLQQRSFREVGGALGVTEDAAKKRVTRALEKLRATLTARGITMTATLLAATLGASAAATAPANVIAGALGVTATSGTSATALTLAGAVARQWWLTRVKWAAALLGGGAAVVALLLTQTNLFNGNSSRGPELVAQATPTTSETEPPAPSSPPALAETPAAGTPANSRTMRLKAVSDRDGKPLADAKVRVVFYGAKYITADVKADPQGVMEITRPERKFEGMAYWISAPAHVPLCVSWQNESEASLPGDYQVELETGVRINGVVVDEDGQPVSEAKLRFNGEGNKFNKREYVDYHYPPAIPTADAQGQWAADFLANRSGWSGFVKHLDYAETEFRITAATGEVASVTVIIKKGAALSGLVLGDKRKPLANAKVTVDWQDSPRSDLKTKTDDAGRFEFAHVTPDRLRLNISAAGHHDSEQWLDLAANGLTVTNVLKATKVAGNATVLGQVVDETGTPVPGVNVSPAYDQPVLRGVAWSTTTDENGRFVWKQAPEGNVRLTFSSWTYEHLYNVELSTDGNEHTIHLKRLKSMELRCTVTDKASGRAVDKFKVMQGERMLVFPGPVDEAFEQLRFAGEGAKGFFGYSWRPQYSRPVNGKMAALLRIEAAGYEPQTVAVTNSLGNSVEVAIQLEREHYIEGVVRTPAGEPAGDAQVALIGGRFSMTMQEPARLMTLGDNPREHWTKTGNDGVFKLAARAGGDNLIIVHREGWAKLPLSGFSGEVQLQPWGRVDGVLYLGQKVGANERICLGQYPDQHSPFIYYFTVNTDAQGRFHFDQVPPGHGKAMRSMLTPFSRDGTGFTAATQMQDVDVVAGETTSVTLGGKGVEIRGRLVASPAQTNAAYELSAQHLRPATTAEDKSVLPDAYGFFCRADGSFTIEDVLPGNYVLDLKISGIKDRHNPEASMNGYTIGERKLEVVVPENRTEPVELGEISVIVKTGTLPAGVH